MVADHVDEDAVLENKPGAEDEQPAFELTLVRACVVALWADGAMARSERDALVHVIASVAQTKREQDRLRRIALREPNRHQVLQDVGRLSPSERLHLFDRCLSILMSDRKLTRKERRFLGTLRRYCGVGFWAYQRMLVRLMPTSRKVVFAAATLVVVAVAVGVQFFGLLPPEPIEDQSEAAEELSAAPDEASIHPDLLLPPPPEELVRLQPEELFQEVRRSVVAVHVRLDDRPIASGSGAVIGIDTGRSHYFVITNRHVIDHEIAEGQVLTFEVEFENQARFNGVLDFYSRRHDLALLAVIGTPMWARPVAMRTVDGLTVGEPVYAMGSPEGLNNTFTSGVISAFRDGFIQTDAAIHSGSSGGPLFDSHGLLCGVVTATHESKDFSFALYADAVFDMLMEREEVAVAAEMTD
jgi:hypothetical protein